jgi:F-type H+-transporting ATPase subunit gamma
MSNGTASLSRQIGSATDLQSVVRTMKAVAASSIGQYERSVTALGDYHHTVELGLSVCLHLGPAVPSHGNNPSDREDVGAIVFGSDQGLVGQFNEVIADFAVKTLATFPGKPQVWAVGERVHERLGDAGIPPIGYFPVPNSVAAIAPFVSEIQIESETRRATGQYSKLLVFHNRPESGTLFAPVSQLLLPLDAAWQKTLVGIEWPTLNLPEVVGDNEKTLRALIREYLFISLFRACAESLASENASRLAAMQRADKNIDELLEDLHGKFQRLRQGGIDEELFDVVSGFEALVASNKRKVHERTPVTK